jgi:hypothetical protein
MLIFQQNSKLANFKYNINKNEMILQFNSILINRVKIGLPVITLLHLQMT